jgi:uncharacterized protein with PIN domain
MKNVAVRIYGPLNDFLPANRRQVDWSFSLETPTSVKDLVEGLGVPHPEIDLILVNGESVSFDYAVQPVDRIAVYPRFKTFDIAGVTRVRPQPLDALRFILDGHLGKLARYLRLVGVDATCPADASDRALADLANRERSILLTRDQALLKRRVVTHGYFVRETDANRQLQEILRHFGPLTLAPFTRCVRCNAALRDVVKSAIDATLPKRTRDAYEEFRACSECGRIYWKGSHWKRLERIVDAARGDAENPAVKTDC